MIEDEAEIHTLFVVGGTYRREQNGILIRGVMLGSSRHHSGRNNGVIYTEGHVPTQVVEGTPSLDEWQLEFVPAPSEIVAVLTDRIAQLEARLAHLEAGRTASPPPAEPVIDLKKTADRKRVAV